MAASYDAEFKIGDVFKAEDPFARLVVRLSMALGDLRIAGKPLLLGWDETPDYARMYHVRVMAGHIAEFMQLIEPEGKTVLPALDDLIAQFEAPVYADFVAEVRNARDGLRDALDAELPVARTSLRREITRLRNQAFHYSYKQGADVALWKALAAAADLIGIYRVSPGAHRALFADEIANQVMHPYSGSDDAQRARLEELHEAIGDLLGPIARLVMNIEALWLGGRDDVEFIHHKS
jgi:hypothetical protein